MSGKHTPGPWRVESNEVMGEAVVSPTKIVALNKGNRDWTANAYLIAAAPDLLSALQIARMQIQGDLDTMSQSAVGRECQQLILDEINKAINKAEGKS